MLLKCYYCLCMFRKYHSSRAGMYYEEVKELSKGRKGGGWKGFHDNWHFNLA